ncbi:MAG TPA: glycoside hydrolase family 3 N-terminal domain-containing protein, partial [Pyrinomonadaceae bacterium]
MLIFKFRRSASTTFVALFIAAVALCMTETRPATASAQATPQKNIEQRINALLARMTLAEKLGQLQMLDGEANGNFRPEHRDLVRRGLLGSTLNVRGAARTNELQRIAMNESRLKIPVLFAFDVIHGYRTVFPVPLGEAASFDPAAAERAAEVA